MISTPLTNQLPEIGHVRRQKLICLPSEALA